MISPHIQMNVQTTCLPSARPVPMSSFKPRHRAANHGLKPDRAERLNSYVRESQHDRTFEGAPGARFVAGGGVVCAVGGAGGQGGGGWGRGWGQNVKVVG